MTINLRVYHPAPSIYAFYAGRVDGGRFAEGKNWVDDDAFSLGISSYAIVAGDEALIYDTHVSEECGAFIRKTLADAGAKKFTVVLSHWHLDHVAGTAAFKDCPVISSKRTADHLITHKKAIENGTKSGAPAINPLILPTQTFDGSMHLHVGGLRVDLIEANIHSDDATVLWLASERMLLAGGTMEDTVTYVGEPENFDIHLRDLDKLWALNPERILPNHGDPDIIALGGYEKTFIRATQQYIRMLKRCVHEPDLREKPLRDIIKGPLEAGWVNLFEPYEAVHRQNVELVLAAKLS